MDIRVVAIVAFAVVVVAGRVLAHRWVARRLRTGRITVSRARLVLVASAVAPPVAILLYVAFDSPKAAPVMVLVAVSLVAVVAGAARLFDPLLREAPPPPARPSREPLSTGEDTPGAMR